MDILEACSCMLLDNYCNCPALECAASADGGEFSEQWVMDSEWKLKFVLTFMVINN